MIAAFARLEQEKHAKFLRVNRTGIELQCIHHTPSVNCFPYCCFSLSKVELTFEKI